MRRTSCSSLSRFYRLVLHALPHLRLPSLSQDYENFIMCPATIRSENMIEKAQGDLLQTQSQDDEQARRDPLPPELPWGKVQQEKNSHSLLERPKLRNAGVPELLWILCKRRTGEAIPPAAKFGRIDNSRGQSLNWDLWIVKQSPMRYREFGSVKIRDGTKLLKADMESFPGIWH